ncbi:MAG: Stp1/IreP family PP2C-type Ser/Thr phosphatase [Candidatus Eisenbacteria bacterium]
MQFAARTDRGRKRPTNQDSHYAAYAPPEKAETHGHLFIVADGMGGHAAGEVASRLATDVVRAEYYHAELSPGEDPAPALRAALEAANGRILQEGERDPRRRGMGTTCTAVVVRGPRAWFAHAGDSRAYLCRGRMLRQITNDHNLAGALVAEGKLTLQEATQHEGSHILTRALGVREAVEIDVNRTSLELAPGDLLLLCSDGLIRVLADADLEVILGAADIEAAADELIRSANERGGPDNITVVLVRIGSAGNGGTPPTAANGPLDEAAAR